MQLARVVGSVVSTQKHRSYTGATLLLVRLVNLDGTPRGATLLAVDGVGAGLGETVLVVIEGRAAVVLGPPVKNSPASDLANP